MIPNAKEEEENKKKEEEEKTRAAAYIPIDNLAAAKKIVAELGGIVAELEENPDDLLQEKLTRLVAKRRALQEHCVEQEASQIAATAR